MLFKKGDFFEVSGKKQYNVIYSDEDIFICCPIAYGGFDHQKSEQKRVVWLREATVFSNKGNLEDKYWIRKIDAYECANLGAEEL